MFDRAALKLKAKERLRGTWFPVPAVTTVILFAVTILLSSFSNKESDVMKLVGFVLELVVIGAFSIAFAHFYLEYNKLQPGEKPKFNTFMDGFNLFVKGVLGYLWMFLWICLWTLCLIVPGIIKSLSYSMTMFILAENPNVSINKALLISSEITKGHKGDIFVIGLSFIGWFLLSALTCGILFIWVYPYIELTMTNTYQFLKEEALRTGSVTLEDFNS